MKKLGRNPTGLTFLKSFGFLWIVLFLFSTLQTFSNWIKNSSSVLVSDILTPLLIYLVVSFFVALLFYKIFIKNKFSGVVFGVCAMLFLGTSYNQNLFSIIKYFEDKFAINPLSQIQRSYFSLIFIICVIGLIYSAAFLVARKMRGQSAGVLAKGISIAIVSSFVIFLFQFTVIVITELKQISYKPTFNFANEAKRTADLPDIYYIVLDRYASSSVLSSQLGFDNSKFINFLKTNGFDVDNDAVSNYPYTASSVSSTMISNLHYDLVDKFIDASRQTIEPYHKTVQYSPIIADLKRIGYKYYHLGSWYESTNAAPQADFYQQPVGEVRIFSKKYNLNSFAKSEFQKSVLWQFAVSGLRIGKIGILSANNYNEAQSTLFKFDYLNQIADQTPGGRFVFAHILAPHAPYFFMADGSYNDFPEANSQGKPIQEKYLNQLQFVNSQVEQIVSRIAKQDNGKAVVVLQADEGPYPPLLNNGIFDSDEIAKILNNTDMTSWSDKDLKMKYGILAAYRIPDANKDDFSVGENPVNIFRYIFNSYFNSNLKYLPKCSYALKNGRRYYYRYEEISNRLGKTVDPRCTKNDLSK